MQRELTERLRGQIVSGLHLGHLRAGDRLPSIRQVAAETGEDARAVARAYRTLETEHLVEVRKRSGIYASPQTRLGAVLPQEAARWAARVLVDGWKRGIAVDQAAEFFARCTLRTRVRCAFVEETEDAAVAFTHDLREHLGVAAEIAWLRELPRVEPGAAVDAGRIPRALRDADLVVTTAFDAREVAPVAEALGKPLVAATVNGDLVAAVKRKLRSGSLTVICADPAFGRRFALQYQDLVVPGTTLRVIEADDRRGIAALDRSDPVLLTRAARQRLGKVNLPLVFPNSPTISASSAQEIVELVVRWNLREDALETALSRN
ncbi:MAG: GntR family transcriptional regulator [Longimicrobiaceae bacterium]